MQKVKMESFNIIGISVRTSNEMVQSTKDIGKLWTRFMSEGILEKIPNKNSNDILSIYTNYEGDHTKPYDTIIGCKVSSLNDIPEGMVGQSFEGGSYLKYTSQGDLTQGHVYNAWLKIWEEKINRAYTADFEVYDERAQNPQSAEIDILISVLD